MKVIFRNPPAEHFRGWDITRLAERTRGLAFCLQRLVESYRPTSSAPRDYWRAETRALIEDLRSVRDQLPAGCFNRVQLWIDDSLGRLAVDPADAYALRQLELLARTIRRFSKRLCVRRRVRRPYGG